VRVQAKPEPAAKANPKTGRAEALRRSMLAMIDQGKDYEAHPAFLGAIRTCRRGHAIGPLMARSNERIAAGKVRSLG
jgi:hypothetical protein